jgi:transcriptional regulator with XRE-family HTH domain
MSENNTTQIADKTIGELIAEARKNAGLSLRTVAARIPIHFTYLSDIENGRRSASEKVLRGLSEQAELNLDFEFLMATANRLGEETENYLKAHPNFGTFVRNIAKENFTETQLNLLIDEIPNLSKKIKQK